MHKLTQVLVAITTVVSIQAALAETKTVIEVNANSAGRPFPHFWEHMFGSCRANLSLRQSYRDDLRKTKEIADVKYLRFHGILCDDIGIYDEDKDGKPIYNFTYLDQVYDGLLENGVRPFVELSFMPVKMASKPDLFGFWYKPSVEPPKDWQKWSDMITAMAKHLVDRYGIDEVSKWYFEVWNEPNIHFWSGEPKQETYWKLYDTSALALKKVDSRLRVGGPSTAQAAWCDKFIAHCVEKTIPFDFVSTHVYANDSSQDVFAREEKIPRKDMVARAMKKVYDQVKASAKPDTPIFWTEFNASFFNEIPVTDSPFMAAWLGNHIRASDGLADDISIWTFSDVFEEGGVAKSPFYGGFGLIATGNIPKASYNALKLLHMLGDTRIQAENEDCIITKRKDGSLAIATWNYAEPYDAGEAKTVEINLSGMPNAKQAKIHLVDRDHGSALTKFEQMGKPPFPSREQQKELRAAAELPAPEIRQLSGTTPKLTLNLKPHSLALIEIINQ